MKIKHHTKFSFLLVLLVTISCDGPGKISSDQLNSFESRLTAREFFWQSRYGSYIDFQFKPNGKVYALINGKPGSKSTGKWSFDDSNGELQIAWEGGRQYAAKVVRVEGNWGKISFSSKIHEFGDQTLTRLKLLDDRFGEVQ